MKKARQTFLTGFSFSGFTRKDFASRLWSNH